MLCGKTFVVDKSVNGKAHGASLPSVTITTGRFTAEGYLPEPCKVACPLPIRRLYTVHRAGLFKLGTT